MKHKHKISFAGKYKDFPAGCKALHKKSSICAKKADRIDQNRSNTFGKKPCRFPKKAQALSPESAACFPEKSCIFSPEVLFIFPRRAAGGSHPAEGIQLFAQEGAVGLLAEKVGKPHVRLHSERPELPADALPVAPVERAAVVRPAAGRGPAEEEELPRQGGEVPEHAAVESGGYVAARIDAEDEGKGLLFRPVVRQVGHSARLVARRQQQGGELRRVGIGVEARGADAGAAQGATLSPVPHPISSSSPISSCRQKRTRALERARSGR